MWKRPGVSRLCSRWNRLSGVSATRSELFAQGIAVFAEGAAVSAVRVDGVAHEFSSVPGVKEDVADIILNLKSWCLFFTARIEINVALVKGSARLPPLISMRPAV